MKTGILGGTFDPIHNAHIMIAEEAARQLSLHEVLFVPASRSPFKQEGHMSSVEDRVRMVELAIVSHPTFRVSTIEIERSGTSYTVDTLEMLKQQYGESHELYFITGMDSLKTLPHWKDSDRIIQLCRLVTVRRPGYELSNMSELEARLPGITERVILLDEPQVDISSTDIRERIANGLEVDGMLPRIVQHYIMEHGLYREGK